MTTTTVSRFSVFFHGLLQVVRRLIQFVIRFFVPILFIFSFWLWPNFNFTKVVSEVHVPSGWKVRENARTISSLPHGLVKTEADKIITSKTGTVYLDNKDYCTIISSSSNIAVLYATEDSYACSWFFEKNYRDVEDIVPMSHIKFEGTVVVYETYRRPYWWMAWWVFLFAWVVWEVIYKIIGHLITTGAPNTPGKALAWKVAKYLMSSAD